MKPAECKITFAKALLSGASIFLAIGCAPLNSSLGGGGTNKETVYTMDGVKLISTKVDRGDDPATYGQRTYTLSASDRLLMRFENLSSAVPRIQHDKPVRVRIFATSDAEHAKALASLRICPITQDWMMKATWVSAHPYKGGDWTPGGNIELDDCVTAEPPVSPKPGPTAAPASETPASAPSAGPSSDGPATAAAAAQCSEAGAICFDVSAWYNNYVLQRGINYGLALISYDGQAVQIYGDGSGSKAPRIHWIE